MSDTFIPNEERNARIIAEWNRGDTTIAALAVEWNCPPATIKDILRRARLAGVAVVSVDPAEATRRAVATRQANIARRISTPPDRVETDRDPETARQQYPQHYDTAFSINDLTTDAYRIVSVCHVVGGLNRWDSTIPTAEMGLLNEQANEGAIFAPQALLGGKFVRLARIVRLHGRR